MVVDKKKKKEWNKKWIANNRDRYNSSKYIYRDKLKLKVFKHYAVDGVIECAYCGFSDIDSLCLDHIENDGAEHRRYLGISGRSYGGGARTYEALIKAKYPKGLQILCANCNMAKEIRRKRDIRMKNKWYAERLKNGNNTTN